MIYAKSGILVDNEKKKIFKLFQGKVINNEKSKVNVFEFDQIDFNLKDFTSKLFFKVEASTSDFNSPQKTAIGFPILIDINMKYFLYRRI